MKFKFLFTVTFLLFFYSCQSQERTFVFNLNGKSSLSVKNKTLQPIEIALENWYILPWKSQKIDTTILADDSVHLGLITQGYSYFNLKIDEKQIKLFSKPDAGNILTLTEDHSKIMITGDLKLINQFLVNKLGEFNSTESEWQPRVNFTHGDGNFIDLIRANDSITNLHQNYLFDHKKELPSWYVKFENKRLQYLNAHWKLNSLMYRKRMLFKTDSIPENFLYNTINSLPINDKSMLGNIRYMNFLSDYVGYNADPNYSNEKPSSKEEWISFYEEQFEIINDQLKGKVKDAYLAFILGNILESRNHIFQNHWVAQIDSKNLKDYVHEIMYSTPILPQGAKIPYFYLRDSTNSIYEPNNFNGKIVLINFWATWCKPCVKEFPFENKLIEKFKNEPVEIVNICIDSEIDTWKRYITKYQLNTTNLIAEGNWNSILKKNFGIRELPHSILIDSKGQVVQNKCPRASEGVDKFILQLLINEKKKLEK